MFYKSSAHIHLTLSISAMLLINYALLMFFAKWCYTIYTIPKSSPAIKAFHDNISDQSDKQSQSLNQHHSFLHQSCEPSIVYMILPFRLLLLIHFHFQIRMSIQTLVQSHFRIIIPTCVLILFRIHFQISTLINSLIQFLIILMILTQIMIWNCI